MAMAAQLLALFLLLAVSAVKPDFSTNYIKLRRNAPIMERKVDVKGLEKECEVSWTKACKSDVCHCYKAFEKKTNWTTAETNCQSFGANLASIHNREEAQTIQKLVLAIGDKNTWIGLHDQVVDGRFEWSDGTPYDFLAWRTTGPGPAQPDNWKGNEACVYLMDNHTPAAYLWNDFECKALGQSVCKKILTVPVSTPIVVKDEKNCEKYWTKLCRSDVCHCYRVFPSKTNWTTASKLCNVFGAHLASIHDSDEAQIISKLVVAAGDENTWIGLNDRAHEGRFEWSDGTPYDFVAWLSIEPNNQYGKEHCVTVIEKRKPIAYLWNDRECNGMCMAACKKKI